VCRQRLFIDLDRAGKSGGPAFIRVREVEAIKGNKMAPYADHIYDDYELFKEDPYEEIREILAPEYADLKPEDIEEIIWEAVPATFKGETISVLSRPKLRPEPRPELVEGLVEGPFPSLRRPELDEGSRGMVGLFPPRCTTHMGRLVPTHASRRQRRPAYPNVCPDSPQMGVVRRAHFEYTGLSRFR
jgi:hypothetical protein